MLLAPMLEVGGDGGVVPVVGAQMPSQTLPTRAFGTLRRQSVQRRDDDALPRLHRQLRGDVEGADGFQLVAEELEAPGPLFAG